VTVPSIRLATLEDVAALVELRLALLEEEGSVKDDALLQALRQATRQYFAEKIPVGEVFAWVAEIEDQVISTGSLILVPKPPSPKNLAGLEAYVFNMYTVPAWRGKGFATRLLDEMVCFVQGMEVGRIRLYATEAGKPLYARAGFAVMRRPHAEMELIW
jgi:GNAT superfamily N-acetyltransferase